MAHDILRSLLLRSYLESKFRADFGTCGSKQAAIAAAARRFPAPQAGRRTTCRRRGGTHHALYEDAPNPRPIEPPALGMIGEFPVVVCGPGPPASAVRRALL